MGSGLRCGQTPCRGLALVEHLTPVLECYCGLPFDVAGAASIRGRIGLPQPSVVCAWSAPPSARAKVSGYCRDIARGPPRRVLLTPRPWHRGYSCPGGNDAGAVTLHLNRRSRWSIPREVSGYCRDIARGPPRRVLSRRVHGTEVTRVMVPSQSTLSVEYSYA